MPNTNVFGLLFCLSLSACISLSFHLSFSFSVLATAKTALKKMKYLFVPITKKDTLALCLPPSPPPPLVCPPTLLKPVGSSQAFVRPSEKGCGYQIFPEAITRQADSSSIAEQHIRNFFGWLNARKGTIHYLDGNRIQISLRHNSDWRIYLRECEPARLWFQDVERQLNGTVQT